MGTMQIMPFLVKALNKTADEKINDLTDMFNPKYNIAFASEHLKFLHKSLYHPLFVAYAYNGGIGFTKRHLLDGTFLKGKYEPFMSMEMMANTESREYGKKVLANYVMYKMILGEKVSIHHLFDTLTQPDETDRFRG
jgi:soluble lytic murein transglycosylase